MKIFGVVVFTISVWNLFAWLFVVGIDLTTIGSGWSKFPNGLRILLNLADRLYPYLEQVLRVQRKVSGTPGLQAHYFLSWILTVLLESLVVMLVLFGIVRLVRGCAITAGGLRQR